MNEEPRIESKFYPLSRPDLIVNERVSKVKEGTRNLVPVGTKGKILDVRSYPQDAPELGDVVWVLWDVGERCCYANQDLDCLKVLTHDGV